MLRAQYATHAASCIDDRECEELRAARRAVGRCDPVLWARAVSARDPVILLKRRLRTSYVNRATFKMNELASMLPAEFRPRRALSLADAPGGFIDSVQTLWPGCACNAMSYEGPDAIRWDRRYAADARILRGLPASGDLLVEAARDAVVERAGEHAVDLVTADGAFDVDLDHAEQQSFRLWLAETACALRAQREDGCFVLKVFEGSTVATRELFELLRVLYRTTMLCKPLCSKAANSERYFVACGLKDRALAQQVARELSSVVQTSEDPVCIASLGLSVSESVHGAFRAMAAAQAQEIAAMISSVEQRALAKLQASARDDMRAYLRKVRAAFPPS